MQKSSYVEKVRSKRLELVSKTMWKTHTRELMPSSIDESPLIRPKRFGGNPPHEKNITLEKSELKPDRKSPDRKSNDVPAQK
jgi:hypothetical protein